MIENIPRRVRFLKRYQTSNSLYIGCLYSSTTPSEDFNLLWLISCYCRCAITNWHYNRYQTRIAQTAKDYLLIAFSVLLALTS